MYNVIGMQLPTKNRFGFTMVELLVVISLVGIFASITSYLAIGNNLKRSRDTKRITDIEGIRSALEVYRSDNKFYPPNLSTLVTAGLLQQVPTDPSDASNILSYGYTVTTATGTMGTTVCNNSVVATRCLKYELCSRLENVTTTVACSAPIQGGNVWRYKATQL
jgi:prepilin-type N-terminal cleavage/methylation domain-containing protein